MKAYIVASFTNKATVNKNRPFGRIIDESYINFLEGIESAIRECDVQAVLPHREVFGWGNSNLTSENLCKRVFDDINSSDILVAYPENSEGSNIVIGWASLLGKKIIILANVNEEVSLIHIGLDALTETRIIKFRDISDLKSNLKNCLEEFVSQK